MKRAAVVVGFLLAACTQSAGPAPTPSAIARQSPSPSVTASTPPVVAVSQLPLTRVDFACRLPVEMTSSDGSIYTGGFITFPAASFTSDPSASILRQQSGDYANFGSPTLYGRTGMAYDVAAQRWAPTDPSLMTPDGRFYAYAIGDVVHVVNVTDGSDRFFSFTVPGVETQRVTIAGFDSTGVYLLAEHPGQYPSGVWVMNPATGDLRAAAQVSGVLAVHAGYAWVGAVDPRDPSPPRLSSGDLTFDGVARVDLATGVKTPWYYRQGEAASLLGLDAHGRPVVGLATNAQMDFNSVSEIRLVEQPGDAGQLIFSGGWGLQAPLGDGDRLWFGGGSGIYLYTAQRGLQNVFVGPAWPVGSCL